MKKLLFAGAAMLSALNVWAVNAQTYTDPNSLPESFEWTMVRYDYRGSELVNIQDDIVRDVFKFLYVCAYNKTR